MASSLDDSSKRIVQYLSERDVAINVLCFQVFAHGAEQLLSRTWLRDRVGSQVTAACTLRGANEPWNGEFYASFGDDHNRSWLDAMEYGFISAGFGSWYTRTLQLLCPGDRVWVKVPKKGFVGVGQATGRVQPASESRVETPEGEKPILEVAKRGNYLRDYIDDPEHCEYFVPVRWLQTVPLEEAFNEIGLFGNQNTVRKPTASKWRSTVDRLKARVPKFDVPLSPRSGGLSGADGA